MSELRQNLITHDWVIIATERAKRPHDFQHGLRHARPKERRHAECPFCPGNEALCTEDIWRLEHDGQWLVRVVPNKFPALTRLGERKRHEDGIFRHMHAVGYHEVIIETPLHNANLALMSEEHLGQILRVYRGRYNQIRRDERVESIIIFKNHGPDAGSSLQHPHSQLAATPVMPYQIRSRLNDAGRFFDDHGECIFCRMLHDETERAERIVTKSAHFTAFIPYAALSPFHTWIFPHRHSSAFDMIADEEIHDLAHILKDVLARMYYGLRDPDYNFVIRSIPTHYGKAEFFHWYLTIIPRVSMAAGFELGSGMFINPSPPEQSAAFLRDVALPG